MTIRRWAFACALACIPASAAFAQELPPTYINQTRFNRGQNVVPVFEGWIHNPDGTYDFVFGYYNRNWEETPVIPVGPDNMLEPGNADRGQPTYFATRRKQSIFRVTVPKDWGDKELVWTLTVNGRTDKAYASLIPVEEISERFVISRGNLSPGTDDPNKPPSITIAPVQNAATAAPVELTALVADDGLPKPPAPPKATPTGTVQGQRDRSGGPRRGLSVTWLEYRGPGKVVFDSDGAIPVRDGKAVTHARFDKSGTYVLMATADDTALQGRVQVTVTVP